LRWLHRIQPSPSAVGALGWRGKWPQIAGHSQVSVLDGGLQKWVAEGGAIAQGDVHASATDATFDAAEANPELVRSHTEMRRMADIITAGGSVRQVGDRWLIPSNVWPPPKRGFFAHKSQIGPSYLRLTPPCTMLQKNISFGALFPSIACFPPPKCTFLTSWHLFKSAHLGRREGGGRTIGRSVLGVGTGATGGTEQRAHATKLQHPFHRRKHPRHSSLHGFVRFQCFLSRAKIYIWRG
jgi:hypothetical protein